jgi:uncharacterized protein YkwD/uncharacterized membrane protein required for colicin V production
MSLNVIDILLVLIVLLSTWHGWRRGFICGSFDLLRWTVSLVAGLRFYQPVGRWLGRLNLWSEVWNQPLAFILFAVISGIAIHLVGYAILKRLSKDIHNRKLNKIFGTVPGLANGLIAAAIVSVLLLAVPLNPGLRERARDSPLANRLAGYTETLEAALRPVFEGAISETLNLVTIRPESNERLSLPYTVAESQPKPDLEARMLELVNNERATAGLSPLAFDPEMTEVARRHSADMFKRGYFAHVTPENRSPFDRISEANISFLTAGENLALAPSVQIAHAGLMKSPGHRANILRSSFGRVGLGIMDGGVHGLMVTQNFRN